MLPTTVWLRRLVNLIAILMFGIFVVKDIERAGASKLPHDAVMATFTVVLLFDLLIVSAFWISTTAIIRWFGCVQQRTLEKVN